MSCFLRCRMLHIVGRWMLLVKPPSTPPDQEIIITLLASWRFDKFPTSKRGKICKIHAESIMGETNIDFEG